MINKKNKLFSTNFLILSILFLSFLLNISKSYYNVSTYEKFQIRQNDGLIEHSFIKSDIHSIWHSASKLLDDDKNKIDFLKSGREYTRTYLPAVIVYLYFKFIGQDIKENSKIDDKYVGGIKYNLYNFKFGLLIIQNLFFICSILYFYKKNNSLFNSKILLIIIAFLCLEPTISQWHSNFFTESIFISLFIFFITYLMNLKNSKTSVFFLGFFVGILYLQKNIGFYLIIPIIIIIALLFKKRRKVLIIFTVIGYLIPVLFIGLHNKLRSDYFYITSKHMKIATYIYLQHKIIAHQLNINEKEGIKIKTKLEEEWIEKNNIDLSKEIGRRSLYNYQQNAFFKSALKNPIFVSKIVIWKTLQSGILDPNYSKTFFKIDKTKKNYWKTEEYTKNLTLKIIYSTIIYLISFIGFLRLIKLNQINMVIINSAMIIFLTLVLGWTGVSRYFVINLVPLSIFFSYGLYFLVKKLKF